MQQQTRRNTIYYGSFVYSFHLGKAVCAFHVRYIVYAFY
jgi:hypothetical protein